MDDGSSEHGVRQWLTGMPDLPTWRRLSASPEKRAALAHNLYFRECWDDVTDLAGASAVEALRAHALVFLKPDAVVGRRMIQAVDLLARHLFIPVGVVRVRHTRNTMLDLWKYSNWSSVMVDWIPLAVLIYTATDTLMLTVRDAGAADRSHASARLASIKGPGRSRERRPHHVRELLRSPNRVLNFLHSADEPADIVREMGIMLDRIPRRALVRTMVDSESSMDIRQEVIREIEALERCHKAHDLDVEHSISRVERTRPLREEQRARLSAAIRGDKLHWDDLCAIIDPRDAALDVWDFISIACSVLDLGSY